MMLVLILALCISFVQGNSEERYSRQLYTLGARAHGQIRRSKVYLDGPLSSNDVDNNSSDNANNRFYCSGLLMECAKNLALSGVGELVFILEGGSSGCNDHEIQKRSLLHESFYEKSSMLDDLGIAYRNAALAEFPNMLEDSFIDIIVKYILRLNPQIKVSTMQRADLFEQKSIPEDDDRPIAYVCIDRPEKSQDYLSNKCRDFDWKFISMETHGVFGRIFCDFGLRFEVLDEDGETPKRILVDEVSVDDSDSSILLVNCVEGEMHDVSKGDVIKFEKDGIAREDNGSIFSKVEEFTFEVQKVFTPTRFTIRRPENGFFSTNSKSVMSNLGSSVASRIKQPKPFTFSPFGKVMELTKSGEESLFTPSDLDKSFNFERRNTVMAALNAASTFTSKCFRTPDARQDSDKEVFNRLLLESGFIDKNIPIDNIDLVGNQIYHSFASGGKLAPLDAFFAAIGAQEALKAVSGLYNPIHQVLVYDCAEILSSNASALQIFDKELSCGANGAGLKSILGPDFMESFTNQRLFIVGSGAIGCEILKNLAAVGAGTGKKGKLILTDMDTIEHSNLSRQLLFRDSDVGKFKSIAAHDSLKRFNPSVKLEAHTSKVGDEDGGPFDDKFWYEGVDTVLNALDNIEARLFIDSKCVENQKALVDAGTLGSKGNVQVVVPLQSESYGSSADPPEPAIPVCTLKNFPYEISHTIQWARDLFEGLYERRPSQANEYSYLANEKSRLATKLLKKLGEDGAIEAAKEISDDLNSKWLGEISPDEIVEKSIQWAIALADDLFNKSIQDLLKQHPVNSLDDDGEPFWSGTRRIPSILSYHINTDDDELGIFEAEVNQQLVNFVRSAARLRAETYLGTDKSYLPSVSAVESALCKVSNNLSLPNESSVVNEDVGARIRSILDGLNEYSDEKLNIVDFEKDDETNDHVSFVTAASNLRALSYGITPVNQMETRRIAGRIVPAMITTTGIVSALSCIELLKLVQKAPLRSHKNAFVNLSLPFFALTSPVPAEEVPSHNDTSFTLWDRIVIKEKKKAVVEKGGITLKSILKKLQKVTGCEITSLSYGPYLIYADFLHSDDKDLLRSTIWELLKEAIEEEDGDDYDRDAVLAEVKLDKARALEAIENKLYLEFSASAEDDETGEEIDLAPIRLIRYRK